MSNQTLWTVISFNVLVLVLPLVMAVLWWKPQAWLTMLTLFTGMVLGFMEPRTEEVIFLAFLFVAFGFFAGFVQPQRAWRWAILLAMWTPLNETFAWVMGAHGVEPPNPIGGLIVFVPAFIGTYIGVLIQRTAHHISPKASTQN